MATPSSSTRWRMRTSLALRSEGVGGVGAGVGVGAAGGAGAAAVARAWSADGGGAATSQLGHFGSRESAAIATIKEITEIAAEAATGSSHLGVTARLYA